MLGLVQTACGAAASPRSLLAGLGARTPREGSGSHGGTRLVRYRTALGSARETGACLDVAVALGYVERVDGRVLEELDEVRAMLATLVR